MTLWKLQRILLIFQLYPPVEVPLVKFDHPIHPILLPPSSPVLPPPDRSTNRLNIGGMNGDHQAGHHSSTHSKLH